MMYRSYLNLGIPDNLNWFVDDGNVYMANTQSNGVPPKLGEYYKKAIKEIETYTEKKAVNLMLNRLPAGALSPVHTDAVPRYPTRYHLPIVTNKDTFFWSELDGFQFMPIGWWYKVDYRHRHCVGNLGTTDRVHLVIDVQELN